MLVQDLVTAATALLGAVTSVAALWLRWRFRLHSERERRHYLTAAAALPGGSRIREQRIDGTRVTVAIGHRDEST